MKTQPIPLSSIAVDPGNPRRNFAADEISSLAASIRERGLLLPLRVKPADAAGKHQLVSGNRRYAALLQLGMTSAPCVIVEGSLDEASVLAEQIVENVLRDNLNPIEEADAYRRYIALKQCSAAQAAAELHVAPSRLSRLLPLCDLPEEVRERVASGAIPQDTAYYLSRVPEGDERTRLFDRALKGELRRDDAARAAKTKTTPNSNSPSVNRITCKLAGGRLLTLSGHLVKLTSLIETLEEVLKEARKARQQGLEISTLAKLFRDRAAAAGGASRTGTLSNGSANASRNRAMNAGRSTWNCSAGLSTNRSPSKMPAEASRSGA